MSEFDGKGILIGLSGGINSMAVLCWLIESGAKPSEVHLFYAHMKEHSPDTPRFVTDGIRLARRHFDNVFVKITRNSVLRYFEEENIIPHPANAPCTKKLKIEPINQYANSNLIYIDLVGYVKHELKRRGERQSKTAQSDMFSLKKIYPIGEFTDEWCFEIVTKHIGWYPFIYTIKDENGERVFKHNNCLPCKNMYPKDLLAVKEYYPSYYDEAMQLSYRLKKYWGRNKDEFYTTFGRDLGQDTSCEYCKF